MIASFQNEVRLSHIPMMSPWNELIDTHCNVSIIAQSIMVLINWFVLMENIRTIEPEISSGTPQIIHKHVSDKIVKIITNVNFLHVSQYQASINPMSITSSTFGTTNNKCLRLCHVYRHIIIMDLTKLNQPYWHNFGLAWMFPLNINECR